MVKLREDSDDMVFQLNSEKQVAACPARYDEGVTNAAKMLKLVRWEPDAGKFTTITLDTYLNTERHFLSSLLLLGEGGLGKSKLLHMVAQELTIAYDRQQYIFGKTIDSLGVLSFQALSEHLAR